MTAMQPYTRSFIHDAINSIVVPGDLIGTERLRGIARRHVSEFSPGDVDGPVELCKALQVLGDFVQSLIRESKDGVLRHRITSMKELGPSQRG